jgi:hypothetical protein
MGLVAIIAGPIMLVTGAPAGWSLFVVAAGVILLAVQWVTAHDVAIGRLDLLHAVLAVAGLACLAVALMYMTRTADDLPRLLPGHDAGSEHYRVVPGIILSALAVLSLGQVLASIRPDANTH